MRVLTLAGFLFLSALLIPPPSTAPSAVTVEAVPVEADAEAFIEGALNGTGGTIAIDSRHFTVVLWEDSILTAGAVEVFEYLHPETGDIVIERRLAPNYIYSGVTEEKHGVQATIARPATEQPYSVYLSLLIRTEDRKYAVETDIGSGALHAVKYERTDAMLHGMIGLVGIAGASHCPNETEEIYGSSDYDWYSFWGDSNTAAAKIQTAVSGMNNIWSREYPHDNWMQQGVCAEVKLSGYMIHGFDDNTADDTCSEANGGSGTDSDTLWYDFVGHLHDLTVHSAQFHVVNHFTAKTGLNCDGTVIQGIALIRTANDAMGCSDTSDRRYSITTMVFTDTGQYIGDYPATILLAHEVGHLYWATHEDAQVFWHDCGWFCFNHWAQTIMVGGNQYELHDHYSEENAATIHDWTRYSWQDPEKLCHDTSDESVYTDPCT